jgi:glycosyltransferase involved in cell wall biosynthesis
VPSPTREPPKLISVVIPVRNKARTLPAQLEALAAQDYRGRWELVIADNASDDRSREVAAEWLEREPFTRGRVVSAGEHVSASHARNRGAGVAGGDFLAFTDADDVVAPTWLSAIARAATAADLVAGEVTVDLLSDDVTRFWHAVSPRQRSLAALSFLPYASGQNTGVWADVFERLGGYDESTIVGEDIEFSWRAQLAGRTLIFAEDAVVHERIRVAIGDAARQHFHYGAAHAHLYRRFAGAGMPRSRLLERAAVWSRVGGLTLLAPWSRRFRGRWALELAHAGGRVAGSVRCRVWYV